MTVTLTLNAAPVHVDVDGVTLYTSVIAVAPLLVKVPVIVVPLPVVAPPAPPLDGAHE